MVLRSENLLDVVKDTIGSLPNRPRPKCSPSMRDQWVRCSAESLRAPTSETTPAMAIRSIVRSARASAGASFSSLSFSWQPGASARAANSARIRTWSDRRRPMAILRFGRIVERLIVTAKPGCPGCRRSPPTRSEDPRRYLHSRNESQLRFEECGIEAYDRSAASGRPRPPFPAPQDHTRPSA